MFSSSQRFGGFAFHCFLLTGLAAGPCDLSPACPRDSDLTPLHPFAAPEPTVICVFTYIFISSRMVFLCPWDNENLLIPVWRLRTSVHPRIPPVNTWFNLLLCVCLHLTLLTIFMGLCNAFVGFGLLYSMSFFGLPAL